MYKYNTSRVSTNKTKNYYGKTKQGFVVKNIFTGRDGRLYGVIERPNDYVVGCGFNRRDNTWAQGVYDFSNRNKAVYYAKKRAYRKVGR